MGTKSADAHVHVPATTVRSANARSSAQDTAFTVEEDEEANLSSISSNHANLNFNFDSNERVFDESYLPVQERVFARTLLAQAGVARGFLLIAHHLGGKKAREEEAKMVLNSASFVGGDW